VHLLKAHVFHRSPRNNVCGYPYSSVVFGVFRVIAPRSLAREKQRKNNRDCFEFHLLPCGGFHLRASLSANQIIPAIPAAKYFIVINLPTKINFAKYLEVLGIGIFGHFISAFALLKAILVFVFAKLISLNF
jgi:hypothetical protein